MMMERSETNELWRAYRADLRDKRDRDDGEYRARLERLEAEGKIRAQPLGRHGLRVRSLINGKELDYWPRTGAIMHKGVRRQGWRALLRTVGLLGARKGSTSAAEAIDVLHASNEPGPLL